jgi:hypothetical protein
MIQEASLESALRKEQTILILVFSFPADFSLVWDGIWEATWNPDLLERNGKREI